MISVFRFLKLKLLQVLFGGEFAARSIGVRVGKDCRIFTSHFGSEPWLVTIGDRATLTQGVVIVTHDGSSWLVRDVKGRRYFYAPVSIGNDVFIGLNSIILPGVRIGDRVIVGAGSVVTRSVPSGCVVAGNPARFIGHFDDYVNRALEEFPTSEDMGSGDYRERVGRVLEASFRSELSHPPQV